MLTSVSHETVVTNKAVPDGFDIIIDDISKIAERLSRAASSKRVISAFEVRRHDEGQERG